MSRPGNAGRFGICGTKASSSWPKNSRRTDSTRTVNGIEVEIEVKDEQAT